MKLLLKLSTFAIVIRGNRLRRAGGELSCWTCTNATSYDDCRENGESIQCDKSQVRVQLFP